MKRFILGIFVCGLLAGTAMAAEPPAGWANLQKLAGSWDITWNGKPGTVTFQMISDGSVLMETQPSENMVTMYHPDNGKLMMTHYCAAHNQPRMVAETSADGKTIAFRFLDATNLASPEDGHMQSMTMTIVDNDHVTETWTFVDHGKTMTDAFHLTRRK